MPTLLKNLNIFFTSKNELNITIVKSQIVFFISSLFELTGILMLGPLIFLATSGESSLANTEINFLYNFFYFNSFDRFFLIFFIATFTFILIGSFASVFSVIVLSRIATDCGVNLGNKLLHHYIYQKWSYLMTVSSNKMINEIYQESSRVTQNIFVPMMMMNKSLILVFFIICGLLYVDVILTSGFFLVLTLVYIAIYLAFRSGLYKNSELLTVAHENRLSFLSDVFELMKQIKIWSNEQYFINGFGKASAVWGNAYKHNLNVALLPRYFVESCILLGVSILIYFSTVSGVNFSESFPKFTVFLFSAFKLLPALQGIYYSSSQIRGNIYSLENIINTLSSEPASKDQKIHALPTNLINVNFENVSFHYPESDKPAIKNISLLLESNKIIGITGKSGSGKSTFCDILMGLLDYQEGSIKINGDMLNIYENKEWFNKISYAPPQTKLINDSVLNNIFFSSEDVYSFEHIKNIVNLDFLESEDSLKELPTANTLSAGQVQRLGLARSIARHSPKLIILDEPTSALDNENMANFIKNLAKLKQDKMIILITHEISILKEVDQVIVFNDGNANSFNSFAEALDQSDELNRLIQANP